MNKSLTVNLVMSGDQIDQPASEAVFRTAMLQRIASRETEQEAIAEAVTAVFDQHLGVNINMPALSTAAVHNLNGQIQNHKILAERVLDYVRANSQGKKLENGSYERPDSIYVISKGRGANSGVIRRADRPVKS